MLYFIIFLLNTIIPLETPNSITCHEFDFVNQIPIEISDSLDKEKPRFQIFFQDDKLEKILLVNYAIALFPTYYDKYIVYTIKIKSGNNYSLSSMSNIIVEKNTGKIFCMVGINANKFTPENIADFYPEIIFTLNNFNLEPIVKLVLKEKQVYYISEVKFSSKNGYTEKLFFPETYKKPLIILPDFFYYKDLENAIKESKKNYGISMTGIPNVKTPFVPLWIYYGYDYK
jgi:hypothetical protein